MENIQITNLGVKRALSKFTEIESIIEYVWNGFDALASIVEISATFNELGGIQNLEIKDNGVGIDRNKLEEKFKPFFQSEKIEQQLQEKKKQNSTFHGKNGIGRLTFFKFSSNAKWTTTFQDEDGLNKQYDISIYDTDLTKYTASEVTETQDKSGTIVRFEGLTAPINISELIEELKAEFCWYLLLNKEKCYKIIVNGHKLEISDLIATEDSGVISLGSISFDWFFVNWKISLKKEYSRYYFINSEGKESFKEYTTFNNKGDKFYHSVYVKSEFFDDFIYDKKALNSSQLSMFQSQMRIYKVLIQELDRIISDRRLPYIRKYSKKIIDDLEEIHAFDNYRNDNQVDVFKKNTLQNFIRELYVIEPKIFAQSCKEQKLTMVRLLDTIMYSSDKESLFKILDSVINLNAEERESLAKLLETTTLDNITKTINFLSDRLKSIHYFENVVYNKNLNANEIKHLQTMLERNYWLFGEQYTAVAKAEDTFVSLVKNHINVLRKDDGEENKEGLEEISKNPDKQKQVDLCCVRQMPTSDFIENIIVEIKHPLKTLTRSHYDQLRKYMDILTSVKEFNADNYKWTFYLIGTTISLSLQDDLENAKIKGRKGLIFEKDNYRFEIYVRTWKSIFNEYKIKYNNIHEKLKIEEKSLVTLQCGNADEVIEKQKSLKVD